MKELFLILKEQVNNLNLIFSLSFSEIKSKYFMHYLGFTWQIISPLIQILIYWFVFGLGFRGGSNVGEYPYFIWLIVGLIPWFFINPTMTKGSNSINLRLSLITKLKFPMSIIPTITIISNSFNFIIMLGILIIILHVYGINPGIYYLQLPYYLICMYVFLYAFTLLFSTLTTIVRDIQALLQTTMKMLFYITPILWEINNIPNKYKPIVQLNPINYIINGFRDTFLYQNWFTHDLKYTLYFWFLTLTMLYIGSIIHLKHKKNFADYL
ncbi:Probable O-antigen/lipopolysaccharide transport integral membrane protein ABC transporter RfbD [Mycobacteroides abscessus subsp. abscessus]|nr:Probable O-antigen/lipopolysaccharide transport integral membrane protein ABC transporter RfbD [Mycobacteroides abscessus subsp. abscessus]